MLYKSTKDIAARNFLVEKKGKKKYVLKVADFGLSRIVLGNEYQQHSQFPIRVAALETLKNGKVYLESDVWSFAIAVWETLLHCQVVPYADLQSKQEILDFLSSGKRLPKPDGCPEQ